MSIIDKNTSEVDFLNLLFKNRHIKKEDIDEFLKPSSPVNFPSSSFGVKQSDLDKAIKRIEKALKNKEKILIYGDYDVDGITATAILWNVLYKKSKDVLPFIPDREADGYGIKAKSFFNFQKEKKCKFDLLITVDNGIVAHKELKEIIKEGTDVIVVDHHTTDKSLPKSVITVHSTKVSGSALSWLLSKEIDKDSDLGLATLGVVSDCLPLNTVNRNIVFHGLKSLSSKPNHGIKKLIEVSNIKNTDSISTYDIGFILGPRINAVGRLGNPTDALRLLCSSSSTQASKYARILSDNNFKRQSLQRESIKSAKEQVKISKKDKLIFLADESFHPGIIGLIAGRLTEEYYLPSIIISIDGKIAKGSCRSIKELNIVESLREAKDLFVDLGGHAGAAGFTVETKNIEKLKKELNKIISQKLKDIELKPDIFVDAQMRLSAVNIKNCNLIQKLQPFGIANLEPTFLFKDVKVINKRLLGTKQDHLKLKLDDPDTSIQENITTDAIAFKKGHLDKDLEVGGLIDIIAYLNLNVWNGYTNPQLIVKEIITKNS